VIPVAVNGRRAPTVASLVRFTVRRLAKTVRNLSRRLRIVSATVDDVYLDDTMV
jgi:hypothetical protein